MDEIKKDDATVLQVKVAYCKGIDTRTWHAQSENGTHATIHLDKEGRVTLRAPDVKLTAGPERALDPMA